MIRHFAPHVTHFNVNLVSCRRALSSSADIDTKFVSIFLYDVCSNWQLRYTSKWYFLTRLWRAQRLTSKIISNRLWAKYGNAQWKFCSCQPRWGCSLQPYFISVNWRKCVVAFVEIRVQIRLNKSLTFWFIYQKFHIVPLLCWLCSMQFHPF